MTEPQALPLIADATVYADHSQYLVLDGDGYPSATEVPLVADNGLVKVYRDGLVVVTGFEDMPILLRVELHPQEPPLDTSSWSEVVEVSFSADASLVVSELLDGPVEGLPDLAFDGPGVYRMRFCALGRDEAKAYYGPDADPDVDPLLERHAILVWRASNTDPVDYKLTDRIGAYSRGRGSLR